MATRPRLFEISYSPWSEKARWALDAASVSYDRAEHVPFLGMPALRSASGLWTGRVSVPLLVADRPIMDSWNIAVWASKQGAPSLFPDGRMDEVQAWNERSERLISLLRVRLLRRYEGQTDALREGLPKWIPGAARGVMVPLAAFGVWFIGYKYANETAQIADDEAECHAILGALSAALEKGPYLLGAFSYADVVMAVPFEFIAPLSDDYIPVGQATRRVFADPALASRWPALVEWRDRIYRDHRR